MWTMSENNNTMEVKLDASAYSQLPSDEDIYEDVSADSFAPISAPVRTTAFGIFAAILVFGIIVAIAIFFGLIAWR
jgi:hypothetical protein